MAIRPGNSARRICSWLARWVATPIALLSAAAWVLTLFAWVHLGNGQRILELEHGCITLGLNRQMMRDGPDFTTWESLADLPGYDMAARLQNVRWLPTGAVVRFGMGLPNEYDASLPLWIPFCACALIGGSAWRNQFRLRRAGVCRGCGYPRQGLDAVAPCPECGQVPRSARRQNQ